MSVLVFPLYELSLQKRYKTYPIDVMSRSVERSESYPIEKSYCKYSFQMETDALSDILFRTIHNYRCVLS